MSSDPPVNVAEALSIADVSAVESGDAAAGGPAPARWLLAGSYSASLNTDDALLIAQLPPKDGFHLFWEPGN